MVARKVGRVMTWRQLVPSVFIALVVVSISLSVWLPIAYVAVAATLGGYGTAVILASAWGARKYCFRTGVFLCAVFPVLHLSYGVGFLRGVANHLLPWRGTRKVTKVSITR